MTTTTKTAAKTTPAKTTPAKATVKTTTATPTPEVKATPATKLPPRSNYRSVSDFAPAIKSARSLAKGNPELTLAVQLITHLAWKTPDGTVGWNEGTTASVVAYADELALPVGTKIDVAMDTALGAATKAAANEAQTEAVAVLTKVVKAHESI